MFKRIAQWRRQISAKIFHSLYSVFSPKHNYQRWLSLKTSLKYYFVGLYHRFDENHIFLFGAGLAFTLFISIMPFLLILFWVLGNFLDSYSVEIQLDTLINTVIPYTDYAEYFKEIIFGRIDEVIKYKNLIGLMGLGGLLITASGLSSSMRAILNDIFGAHADVNLLIGKLRDFALIFISVIVFLVVALLLPALDLLRNVSNFFFELKFLQYGIFQKLFTTIFSFSLLLFVFSVLYYFVPIKKITFRSACFGALWAAIMWEGMKQVFGIYIYKFAIYGQIYGTYALIIVIAFWVYYSSTAFIVGAVIGKLHHDSPARAKSLKPVIKTGKNITK
jgi:membrane protein